jgi:hypothetical protein
LEFFHQPVEKLRVDVTPYSTLSRIRPEKIRCEPWSNHSEF